MIDHPAFPIHPWRLAETYLDLDVMPQTESLFALSNGHIGLRANLDEGEPHAVPGSYLNSFYEVRPLPYAEAGYGYPEAGQTVVNVTNGKIIRLLVDDEPFDVRYGTLRFHRRTLDFHTGILTREVEWESPTGCTVRVRSQRLVSFTQRALAAIHYEVEPVDCTADIVVQSELVANEPPPPSVLDPRAAAVLMAPLAAELHDQSNGRIVLVHTTKASGLRMAAGMDHVVDGPEKTQVYPEVAEDLGRLTVATRLEPGKKLTLHKMLAYGWSSERSAPALRDQVDGALASARWHGWEAICKDQKAYLDDFWARADVELEGDGELQQALRFAMFHVLQSAARAEGRPVPAKGLTGPGYDGHTFWDAETFVLRALTYTTPSAVRDALTWRQSILPLARDRARVLGLGGATFPWRTIHGEECSGYWPAGTAAFHINADIADACVRYRFATDDESFELDAGLEILIETARLWRVLGHHDLEGKFRIDGVTGPDEYSALKDNNVYTNLMAQRNMQAAADAVERHPVPAAKLGAGAEDAASWRDAAAAMYVPYDETLQVHSQAQGFTRNQVWDFEHTPPDHYPLLLHYPYFDLYRKQVVKQADLVLALELRGDHFTPEEKARDFDYYEPLTVRDSSLSACTQAVMAAEVGHHNLAFDYLGEAALMDLDDLEHNTRDGVHIASLAGTWIAIVVGLGGMRGHYGDLTFAPRLPEAIARLAFRLEFRGRRLKVEVKPRQATYRLLTGEPVEIGHHGERFELRDDEAVTRPIPPAPAREAPRQPPGREPARRRPARAKT